MSRTETYNINTTEYNKISEMDGLYRRLEKRKNQQTLRKFSRNRPPQTEA